MRLQLLTTAVLAGLFPSTTGSPVAQKTVRWVTSRLVCVCGCSNMIVAVCSCAKAAEITAEVTRLLEAGENKEAVLAAYERKYGAWVLAAPKAEGFNWAAWILPFVAFLLIGSLIVAVIYRSLRAPPSPPPDPLEPASSDGEAASDYRKRIEEELRS